MNEMEHWVAAYLEWIDVPATGGAMPSRRIFVERRGGERRANASERSREDILLIALRAESDCVHMLRTALENSGGLATQVH